MSELPRIDSFWKRFAADVRAPLWALAVLAVVMTVGFPIWRLVASREKYICHFSDDAFYYFSVAPNIAAGLGPTADGITYTTGWHPLYGFILAGLCRLTHPSLDGLPREAIALNAVFYLLSAYVLYLAGRRWWGRAAGLAAALLWLTCGQGVYMAAAGLETSTYVLCLALLLWRLADLVTRPRATAGGHLLACALVGLCAALTVLARTDSVLLMPLVALILLAKPITATAGVNEQSRDHEGAVSGMIGRHLLGVAVFGLFVVAAHAAWIAYVYRYTGELNQGSAAVKMEWRKFLMRDKPPWAVAAFTLGMWGEFVSTAFVKVPAIKWLLTGIPLLWRAAAGRAERGLIHLLWLVPVVLGLAYGLLLDWARAWYCVPALLTVTLLAAGAGAALLNMPLTSEPAAPSGRGLHSLQRLVRSTLGLIAWAVVLESGTVFAVSVFKEFDADSEKLVALRVAGWLEKNAEPHARVGCWHSGIIGYYTPSLDVINLDGLNNNDILPILRGDRMLNPYWDRIGLAAIIPTGDIDAQTGEVGRKMGRFQWQWDHKRLVRWQDDPSARPLAASLDLFEQGIPQTIRRIVPEDSPPRRGDTEKKGSD